MSWGGIALLLSAVLPYDVIDDQLLFVWQVLPELDLAGTAAALAGAFAGLGILVVRWSSQRTLLRALSVLVLLATAALWTRLGSEKAAWGLISVPDSIGHRSPLMLFSLAATAAGLRLLRVRPDHGLGRLGLGSAALMMLLFFLWPGKADLPLSTLGQLLLDMTALPSVFYVLGHLLYGFLLAFPFAMGVLAACFALRPTLRVPRALPLLPTFGLSAFLCVLILRNVLLTLGNTSVVAVLGVASVLAAVLELLACSLEVVAQSGSSSAGTLPSRRPVLLRGASYAGAGLLLLVGPQVLLSRPPDKGVEWTLRANTPQADELFGSKLTAWSQARLHWDAKTRQHSAAGDMVKMQAASHELLKAAQAIDPGLEAALRALTIDGRDLDLAGLRWARLVNDVNERSRLLGLPYYVDAFVSLRATEHGMNRLFKVSGYRIEAVRPVLVDGEDYATLHVRRLGEARDGHGVLGFSRDTQPFALVVKNEIEDEVAALDELALAEAPHCEGTTTDVGLGVSDERTCLAAFELLRRESAASTGGLLPVITRMTERHELQHQIDGPHLALSGAVTQRLRGIEDESKDRVNRELSAYLAEMSAPDSRPKLVLLRMLHFGQRGGIGPYAQIAAITLGHLAGDADDSDLRVNAAALERQFLELSTLDDDSLRARARALWRESFDGDLPEVSPAPP